MFWNKKKVEQIVVNDVLQSVIQLREKVGMHEQYINIFPSDISNLFGRINLIEKRIELLEVYSEASSIKIKRLEGLMYEMLTIKNKKVAKKKPLKKAKKSK